MRRALLAFFSWFALSIPTQGVAENMTSNVLGAWRLVSAVAEEVETGKKFEPYGAHPVGYLVYLPEGRMFALGAPADREPSKTDEERLKRHRTTFGYSGRYMIKGNTVTHHVDMSVHPETTGMDLVRHFALEGDKLVIRTVPRVNRVSGTTSVTTLVWEKTADR